MPSHAGPPGGRPLAGRRPCAPTPAARIRALVLSGTSRYGVCVSNADFRILMDELIARQDEIARELLDAIGRGVPKRYRDLVLTECRPHLERLWPACLRCIRHGTELTAEELAPVMAASARRGELGVPLSVTLLAIRAAIGRLGRAVVACGGATRPVAVATVLSRAAVLSHQLAQAASAGRAPAPTVRPAWVDDLDVTDLQVLRLAAHGLSTRQIAAELHYSEQAVSYHLTRLMRLTGVSNRTALVARALHHDLISLPPTG